MFAKYKNVFKKPQFIKNAIDIYKIMFIKNIRHTYCKTFTNKTGNDKEKETKFVLYHIDLFLRKQNAEAGNKKCSDCEKYKPLCQFGKDINEDDGHKYQCKLCYSLLYKSRYLKYKDAENERQSAYRKTASGRFTMCRQRAKSKKLDFSLTFEEFENITNSECFYCGEKHSKDRDYLGIDRANSSIGYVKENCLPCCDICNWMKNDSKIDDFKEQIIKIYNNLNREK